MRTVRLRGISLAYDERGDISKPPVILIHGSASDYRTWAAQMDAFAQQYHVIAYSRRSHYPNPYVEYEPDYSVKVEADDLAELIKRLGLEPAHLVGWSYGAFIAASVARNQGGLVRSLVLAEPPIMSFLIGNPVTEALCRNSAASVHVVKELLNVGKYREAVQNFIDSVSGQGAFEHAPPEQQRKMLQNAKTLYELTTADRDLFSCSDAMAIAAPTLLVTGEKSATFLHKIAAELRECLREKESAVIKDAGHSMHSQNPPDFNRAVLEFLDAQYG